jgi:lysozyme family protein
VTDLVALRAANARRWLAASLTRNFSSVAKHLVEPVAKARYVAVSNRTGVPWWFIAVVHERESAQSWGDSLAQGDPWNKVSVHVPAGRGPFKSWEDAAVDALVNCAPFAARNKDWSIGSALTMLEQYNGLGYAARGKPSPYVWSGTDQYVSGKYVRDGVYNPDVVDQQLGCAGLLLAMMPLDPSIHFASPGQAPPVAAPPRAPVAPPPPSITQPAKGSIGAAISSALQAILSIFKRGK